VDWADIRVAHLDTGFTRHPAFGFRPGETSWLLPAHGLNLLATGEPRDTLDYEGNPGHGTRTCSILCGEAVPLPGQGPIGSEVGVAPRLPVVPCRIVRSVVLTGEDKRRAVGDGIRHAIATGCQVVSISLGTPAFPFWAKGGMGSAVDAAYEAGIIIVAAGGQIVDRLCYPAKFNRTIGVGGVTHQGRIWFEYGAGNPWLDVWAPAKDVLRVDSLAPAGSSTVPPVEGADPGIPVLSSSTGSSAHSGKSGPGTGTSYATVHVAAAAAMWLRAHGADIAASYGAPWQRVEAFRQLLRTTGGQVAGKQPGKGPTRILDIEALIKASLPPAATLAKAEEDNNKHL
jgi:subtilisin family serine protease